MDKQQKLERVVLGAISWVIGQLRSRIGANGVVVEITVRLPDGTVCTKSMEAEAR